MKPRTKLDRRIIAISNSLPEFSQPQKQWAYNVVLDHVGYRSKKQIACLDCGHIWNGPRSGKTCVCPGCNTKITIQDVNTANKKKLDQRKYFCILDVREEFQVVRHFELFSYHRAGEEARRMVWEVIRQFITIDGKVQTVARNWTRNFYIDSFGGDLEIRKPNKWGYNKYDIWPDKIYPKVKLLPIYKRNGYKRVDGISPYVLFNAIIKDSTAETLLKAKHYGLLAARVSNKRDKLEKYWDSVKICIRAKYVIKVDDVATWLDYLDLLVYFKRDIRNPKYVCPVDLNSAHNKLVAKKTEIDEHKRYSRLLTELGCYNDNCKKLSAAGLKAEYDKVRYTKLLIELGRPADALLNRTAIDLKLEYDRLMDEKQQRERMEQEARELERRKKEFLKDQKAYDRDKKMFFGLVFKRGELTIKVLESIQEFLEETEAHGHCVFTSSYYKRKDSLVFSDKVNGKPIETVEISLKDMSIAQARGLNNKPSKYHDEIIKLMQRNLPVIRKRYREQQKVAA